MSRTVVLLPSSKGKAAGGQDTTYGSTLLHGPLTAPRRELLDAVQQAARTTDSRTFARLTGLGADEAEGRRSHHVHLADAPTLPAHLRYTGIVHGNAGLAAIDPRGCPVDIRIVSALLGLASLGDRVPDYRLELGTTLPGIGGIATYWRQHVVDHLRELTAGARVWDLLPGEHARVWPARSRPAGEVITVRFVRPDGRPANAARAKVCKGRLVAALLRWPEATPRMLAARATPGEGWELSADTASLTATFRG